MKWTPEQDAILQEFGRYGAAKCSQLLAEKCGVKRKPEAVRRHAYRIGASMVRYEICAKCGRKAKRLDAHGLCPICSKQRQSEEQRKFNTTLKQEVDSIESSGEYRQAKREYEKARQANSRLCRQYGLPNFKERGYGDYAKCHKNLSLTRSDA